MSHIIAGLDSETNGIADAQIDHATGGLLATLTRPVSVGSVDIIGQSGPLTVSGSVTSTPAAITTPFAGQKAVTESSAALASQAIADSVTFRAPASNAKTVYVGPGTVSASNGFPIDPGAQVTLRLPSGNLDAFSVIGGNTTDVIGWIGS
jgi:hypothetical protein